MCVQTLAQIGGNAALEQLIGYAGRNQPQVNQALADVWNMFDHHIYAKRVLIRQKQLILRRIDTIEAISLLSSSLTELYLSKTSIRDLSPLVGLSRLTVLDLSSTQVRNIAPLAGLPYLTQLDLSWTQVRDLTPLAGIKQTLYVLVSKTQEQQFDRAMLRSLRNVVIMTNRSAWQYARPSPPR